MHDAQGGQKTFPNLEQYKATCKFSAIRLFQATLRETVTLQVNDERN